MTMYKNIDNYMTPAEASQKFNVSRKTLNSRLNSKSINDDLDAGLIKKFVSDGSTRAQWILSKDFMIKYYGHVYDNDFTGFDKNERLKYLPDMIKKADDLVKQYQKSLDLKNGLVSVKDLDKAIVRRDALISEYRRLKQPDLIF